MGVLKELKELVRDMGGDASKARIASQAIDKIPASGGSSGVFVVHANEEVRKEDTVMVLDRTFREIEEAAKTFIVRLVF